ncbi:MAG: hypothetical protein KDA74_02720 [Planctomycetaceae bacterium]|nr:hypothetical protein [Planctomycetaceae bacterium]
MTLLSERLSRNLQRPGWQQGDHYIAADVDCGMDLRAEPEDCSDRTDDGPCGSRCLWSVFLQPGRQRKPGTRRTVGQFVDLFGLSILPESDFDSASGPLMQIPRAAAGRTVALKRADAENPAYAITSHKP